MKQLIKLIANDIAQEGFSKKELLIYGVLAPIGAAIFCSIAEFINSL